MSGQQAARGEVEDCNAPPMGLSPGKCVDQLAGRDRPVGAHINGFPKAGRVFVKRSPQSGGTVLGDALL
ncbi:hypothetical protein [Streptomyces sp. SAS_270]|uniref:hypothetical protein n=1 Tax=Streptomyces sp. SAS_270 TaxID=3412748 RepID=UPI00403C047A